MKYSEDIKLEIGGKFINGDYYKNLKLLTKDLDRLVKSTKKEQLMLGAVSQQRELLIAYEKNHYTPQEWVLASKQCIEDIDNFLAINCG